MPYIVIFFHHYLICWRCYGWLHRTSICRQVVVTMYVSVCCIVACLLACWRSDRDEEDTRTDKEVYGQSPRQEAIVWWKRIGPTLLVFVTWVVHKYSQSNPLKKSYTAGLPAKKQKGYKLYFLSCRICVCFVCLCCLLLCMCVCDCFIDCLACMSHPYPPICKTERCCERPSPGMFTSLFLLLFVSFLVLFCFLSFFL